MMRNAHLVLIALMLGCAELPLADLQALLEPGEGAPSESTVASGLREALRIGSERAATTLAKPGGFGTNPILRLALPDELENFARSLRTVGLGSQVDSLEAAMNRAAERAASEAVSVFASAISSMTIQDAFSILNGGDDAATQYFKARTSEPLRERFAPRVAEAMEEVGLYDLYRKAVDRYERIPFSKPAAPSLEEHVVDGTLSGLFHTLSAEERRIREDPAARTTELLRSVFTAQTQP